MANASENDQENKATLPKIHFVTYGNHKYANAIQAIAAEAARFPFDSINLFRETDLQQIPEFWDRHGEFVRTHPRGNGYWIWKPFIIKKMLLQMRDGDILVYADSGCSLDASKMSRFCDYINAAYNDPKGLVSFKLDQLQRKWTKMDTAIALGGVDLENGTDTLGTCQISATSFIICKRESTVKLIDDYYENCCNYHLIDDSPSAVPNDPQFIEHRHDQAVFSLLRHQYGGIMLSDETYPPGDPSCGPILATRRRG